MMGILLQSSPANGSSSFGCFSFPKRTDFRLPWSAEPTEGVLPAELSKLRQLVSLDFSNNSLSGSVMEAFSGLENLLSMNISSNLFYGTLSDFGVFTKLAVFNISNNSFTGLINSQICMSSKIQVIDVSMNRLTGDLQSLDNCTSSLQQLHINANSFTGQIPSYVYSMSSLEQLTIAANNFSGPLSNDLGFKSLMVFALGNCGLNGQIPNWLLNCTELQVLDLSWNNLQGNVPSWIGKMDKLFYMDFSNNSLTGEIPKSLTQLKRLVSSSVATLDPSVFIGTPLYVKRNQSARGLQYNQPSNFPPSILLSNNRLNGTIPTDIGRLKQLHSLDLGRNNIGGAIPDSISDLSNLEVLDLSHNDLTGSIPPSFVKLNFLSRFSVAFNQLQGQIPTKGQFLSFSNSSYDGNPGLCGMPVLSPCGLRFKPAFSSHSAKIRRSSILGITISVGVIIALLLATILHKVLGRDSGNTVDYLGDEESRVPRSSEGLGSSKLELFQYSDCKELTVDELLKSTDNFSQANIIGCGGFGLVYKATLPNGTNVAIKRMSGDCCQMEREFHAEVEALSRAQHKNLVSLQGYCEVGNDRLLIYTFMENGSLDYWLHECIDGNSVLNWSTRLKIAQGAGHGLAYLHTVCDPNIIHRDIKSSNILLNENFDAHLADFGLSRLLHPYDTHVTTDLVGTLGYIPPEYSQSLTATVKGDVYSFGVVLLELLTGRRPVEVCKGKNCRDLVSWVFQMKSEKKEELVMDASIWKKDDEKQLLEEDGNRRGADTRSMNTPPIENPQHIKKDISVGGNDNDDDKEKETYSDADDSNDDEGLDTVDEEASTLLKDQSGAQDQSSS
ncbi:hypothetical protein V2J09_023714 [Rumex salicifolius]